jgi:hypothetical protein
VPDVRFAPIVLKESKIEWLRILANVDYWISPALRCSLKRRSLHNHAPDIAAVDLFVVPTVGFDLLYAFVIVRLGRRDLVWINVTANSTAEWIARQLTEAFPWDEVPRYLIRDRDRIYGSVVTRRLYCAKLTLAERRCRTADWIDPA